MKTITFPDRYGPWALVAGASDGMGAAYARALAQRGLNIVLIARREALLEQLETEITAAHRVDVRTLVLDLSRDDRLNVIADQTSDIDIGLLIYNAAYPVIGPFLDQSLERQLRSIRVNCDGPIQLAHHFGRRMSARGLGGIILMSSLSSLQGAALIANYAATKAWTLAFAEALSFELGDLGVDVLASCPGATRTPSYEAGNPRQTSFLAPAIMEPDQVVH